MNLFFACIFWFLCVYACVCVGWLVCVFVFLLACFIFKERGRKSTELYGLGGKEDLEGDVGRNHNPNILYETTFQ